MPASDLGDGLNATIPRSDIQAVLAAEEEPIELVLDITRSSDSEAATTRNVSVTWERSDLEKLLGEAQGDDIVLTFDGEALARATDDVEAHGFREVALAVAIAATAAGGAAAGAAAEPGAYLGGKAPIEQSAGPEIPYLSQGQGVTEADLGIATGGTSPDDRAVARTDAAAAPAAPAGPEIPYLSHGQGVSEADLGIATGTSPDDRAVARTDAVAATGLSPDDRAVARTDAAAPAGPEIPYLSQGQGVTEADLGIATGGTSPDDRAVARTDAAAAPAAPAGPEIPYLSQGQGVTPAELGIGTGTSPDDRAVPRTDPVATTGGTVSEPSTFSVPGPDTAVIIGTIALLITGAYFLIGTDRRRVRPI